ncbi:MAG: hypothetical protein U9O94_09200, partial [Nanoarchaeota archaeon]|nr:hypothetical protein [Nanoarchaeota archaeon]
MAFQRKGTALALANVDGRLGNQNNLGAGIKSFKSLVSVLSADVDGDQYPVALVPSNAVLSFAGTLIRNTAITGGTSYKIAVHYNDISQDGDIGD